ncbi:MAG: hypothetical protein JJ872_09025 [Marivivens sp.]|nr:hypothetical protein [Marivivens sp.]
MPRIVVSLIAMLILVACGAPRDDLSGVPDPVGRFLLGHTIVVAPNMQVGPMSREASSDIWIGAVKGAVQDRLGRYEGDAYYHVAMSLQGYVLAEPGIPILYAPNSVLIFEVTFYEDATQTKLNEEPIQITVFEPCCRIPLIGSGITLSAEEQMDGLAFNAARAVERTIRENGDWFGGIREVLPEDETILQRDDLAGVIGAVDGGEIPSSDDNQGTDTTEDAIISDGVEEMELPSGQ